jgi:hypothetical protein
MRWKPGLNRDAHNVALEGVDGGGGESPLSALLSVLQRFGSLD